MDHPRGLNNLRVPLIPILHTLKMVLPFAFVFYMDHHRGPYNLLIPLKPTLHTPKKVLPFAFVFHMDHPRGDWLKSDVQWSLRGPSTLDRFFVDVQTRYATSQSTSKRMADDVQIETVATELGQNCSAACENVGLGCRGMNAGRLKTYFLYP
jgi:hypothetical protein